MRKNIMFVIAIVMLVCCLIGLIKFLQHQHIKTGVMCAICFGVAMLFYLFGIIEDRDEQIADLRSKLFKANKAAQPLPKESWLEPENLSLLKQFNDINSIM